MKLIENKVQVEKGNKSPNRIWKVNEQIKKKKSFLRPRCEIAVKKQDHIIVHPSIKTKIFLIV